MSCENENEKIEKVKQIKIGMSRQQVVEIMGKPDVLDSVDNFAPFVEGYYYKVYLVEIFSDPVIVWFDSMRQVGASKFA